MSDVLFEESDSNWQEGTFLLLCRAGVVTDGAIQWCQCPRGGGNIQQWCHVFHHTESWELSRIELDLCGVWWGLLWPFFLNRASMLSDQCSLMSTQVLVLVVTLLNSVPQMFTIAIGACRTPPSPQLSELLVISVLWWGRERSSTGHG